MQQTTPLGVATSGASTTRSVLQQLPWISPAQRLSAELVHEQPRPRRHPEGAVSDEARDMRVGKDRGNFSVDVDEEGVVAFTQQVVCARDFPLVCLSVLLCWCLDVLKC